METSNNINLLSPEAENLMQMARDRYDAQVLAWINPLVSTSLYWSMFQQCANNILKERGIFKRFICDKYNEYLIVQLYYYLTGNPKGDFDITKGIYLGGKPGAGKTLILSTFVKLFNIFTNQIIEVIPARYVLDKMESYGMMNLKKRQLMIDDLGRESLTVKLYGNDRHPITELTELRYEHCTRTFYTSNFTIDTLSKGYDEKGQQIGYGRYIGDRIREKSNFYVLPGDSRR